MATTTDQHDSPQTYAFEPKLHPRWALRPVHLMAVALFGILFVMLSYFPLRPTDLWSHVHYGELILAQRAIPTADPWMPLAEGMPVVDNAWLSQVLFALVHRAGGPEALSLLFALTGLASYLLFTRAYYLRAGHAAAALLTAVGVVIIGWSRIATIRPENFAVLALAALLWLLAGGRGAAETAGDGEAAEDSSNNPPFPRAAWFAVPLLFALWANLHGSFVCGLAVLACFTAGSLWEGARRTRRFAATLADPRFRRWLFLTELAALATLLNPYGVDLWLHTLQFAKNPNLQTVLEWQPLALGGIGGGGFLASVLVLMFLLRRSRLPFSAADVLLLLLFGFATLLGVRMIGWYAALFGWVVAPHLGALAERLLPTPRDDWSAWERENAEARSLPPGRSWRYSLVGLLLIWIFFALSPASRLVLGRAPRTPQQVHGQDTPLALAEYLRANPPRGQVFHPQWWGDWLKHAGPPELQPFATSNIHLVPPQVWRDYGRILSQGAGWERALDRYRVTAIVVDRKEQDSMFRSLRQHEEWALAYEDEQAALFLKTRPVRGARPRTAPEEELAQQRSRR